MLATILAALVLFVVGVLVLLLAEKDIQHWEGGGDEPPYRSSGKFRRS
jgi:hypothetical protein